MGIILSDNLVLVIQVDFECVLLTNGKENRDLFYDKSERVQTLSGEGYILSTPAVVNNLCM